MTTPELGKIVGGKAFRDAIHIAVIPLEAGETLKPGSDVKVEKKEGGYIAYMGKTDEECVGIVDPFLNNWVERGETFWCLVYPNTIESLRHSWSSPKFR